MDNFIGSIWKQNCGDSLRVIEQTNMKNGTNFYYRCQFLDYPCEVLTFKQKIQNGNVANYLYPSLYNKGYLGIGKYNFSNNRNICEKWRDILRRCYDNKRESYKNYGAKGVTVCESWFCCQNFASWYEENSKWNVNNYILNIDKDILANINHSESKVYSPETCLLIPEDLNTFLIGDGLMTGLQKRENGNYRVNISFEGIKRGLGTYKDIFEAKQVYAREKYKIWLDWINKFNLPSELKKILLQYNFSWYWLKDNK